MSYILEALKKAEAEREQGAIPSLTTGQASSNTYVEFASQRKSWWLLVVPFALLALAWWVWSARTSGSIAGPAALPVSVSVAVPVPAVQVPTPAATPAATTAAMPAPSPAPTPAAVIPTAKPASPTSVAAPPQTPEPAASPAPVAPVRSASGGIPILAELPESVRRQIPPINISGAVNSDSPVDWALIINDQVLSKGSQVAPDLRLEEVSASSAVFNFKGQRFRIDR